MESGSSSTTLKALKDENRLLRENMSLLTERAAVAERLAEEYRQKQEHSSEKIALLTHELAQLKRLIYGVKSERFEPSQDEDQLGLFGEVSPPDSPTQEKWHSSFSISIPRAKRKPHRQVLPDHLPRETIVIEPEVDTSRLKKIGEEVTETLDYRPAKLVVVRRVRPKYIDPAREECGVLIGELPMRPIEKGICEPGLLAHLLISKYVDHLPYYRQLEQFKREQITLAPSTIGGWGTASAELLRPLYDRLAEHVRRSGYVQADETPIAVQDRKKKRKTHRGYYWVYLAPDLGMVCMDYQEGRGRDGPSAFLDGFTGALQSDGYVVYDTYDDLKAVTTYGCWAHARRHFFEATDNAPQLAEVALTEIGGLYEIERRLRESHAPPEIRCRVRKEKAVLILDRFKTFLEANEGLPKSPWGKAASYSLTRWDKLTRYIENGRIEIDNNLVENAIRPIALGRKNYLFAGSHAAAQRAAVIYSLLATCKRNDVNPQIWLSDVLSRIATHPIKQIDELMPHLWEKRKR